MACRLELKTQVAGFAFTVSTGVCGPQETIGVVSCSDRFALYKDHQGCLPWKPTPGGQK